MKIQKELIRKLNMLRFCKSKENVGMMAGRCWGYIDGLLDAGAISSEENERLEHLIMSATEWASK